MNGNTAHLTRSQNDGIPSKPPKGIRSTLSRNGISHTMCRESPASSGNSATVIHTGNDAVLQIEAGYDTRHIISHLVHVVHEIRNPLNGIIPLIEMLRSGEYEDDRMKFLEYMDISAQMIQTLVNNVLDVARLEAGKMDLQQVALNPAQLLSEVVKSQMGALLSKGILLTTDIAPAVPHWLEGDAFHLKQILMNLLGNAVKFTDKGAIAITVTAEDCGFDRIMLGIDIKDSGIGMTREELQCLFRPFAQVPSSATPRHGGSGLGLAISLKLATLMGGDLWAESMPGQGSTFHLQIPLIRITPTVT